MIEKLDKWDCAAIALAKQCPQGGPQHVDEYKAIWAERVNIDIRHVHLSDMVEHYTTLYFQLPNLAYGDRAIWMFLRDIHPQEQWKFTHIKGPHDHWHRCFRVLMSRFALTPVKDLPGYEAYMETRPGLSAWARC